MYCYIVDCCATSQLICSHVLSRLDYCNSLLSGITKDQLTRLQRVQNNAAKLIFKKKRRDHVTPLLKKLHWLPIENRIDYKLATLVYRHFDSSLPSYLSSKLTAYTPARSLRSSSEQLLAIPRMNLKTAGERSFRYQASRVWNSLPIEIRSSGTLPSFKQHLKTHLFRKAFN